ncbi:Protein of unknown function [Monaibacterium marinum]|uniref:Beta-barrel assembly machine subunit BamF n=1 Tax=Pontivivens marinum TaxID=1690039 RepID=A0A2C9CRV1_9RHOB|nr:DUF3035 domain-containing protein [Monaibacterium marinum]SOH93109.1 Protein of unknown function [Monaibacterium marinum]
MKTTFPSTPIRAIAIMAALGAVLVLSACGDDLTEERSLLERAQVRQGGPDPFMVVEHGMLEIPANIRALPTPRPGAVSRVEPQPDQLVAAALGGTTRSFSTGPGAAEQMLLANLRTETIPADLRDEIQTEHQRTLDGADTGIFASAFSSIGNPYRDQQLDPVAELARLRREYPNIVTPNAPLGTPE